MPHKPTGRLLRGIGRRFGIGGTRGGSLGGIPTGPSRSPKTTRTRTPLQKETAALARGLRIQKDILSGGRRRRQKARGR